MRGRFGKRRIGWILVMAFAVACYAQAGTIQFGTSGVSGARFEVTVNGTTLDPISVTSQDGVTAAQATRDAINAAKIGLTATINPNTPKFVEFPGGHAVRVKVLDGCIDNEYHSDPASVSFSFAPGSVQGDSCGGGSSTANLFLNNFSLNIPISPGQSTQDMVQNIASILTAAGFQLSVSSLELNVLTMPDGSVPTDGGFGTNDVGL